MTAANASVRDYSVTLIRLFSLLSVTITYAFLLEVWLVHWRGHPRALEIFQGNLGAPAIGYVFAVVAAILLVARPSDPVTDALRIDRMVAYIARAAFFAIFFVGIGDSFIAFLRVEGLLPALVGEETAALLSQARWRVPYIHFPLIAAGMIVALFTQTLGFIWLTLLVVVAQILLVIGRFIFSYEHAFMSDLIRMWYAGLFLFSSAYTLVEEGHVRVDVLYATMSDKARALVNCLGSVFLGMTVCWTILIFGTAGGSSPIIGPLLRFETGQQSYGLMTKYLLAVFLGVFAVTMIFQFASALLKSFSEWRNPQSSTHDSGQSSNLNLS